MQSRREEKAIILDFLPNGYVFDKRPIHLKTPIAQAIGMTTLALLELVPRKGVFLQPQEIVYIGESKRDKIHHINARISYSKLTETAKSELEPAVTTIVLSDEKRFVDFFNKAPPITTRMHSLELLPGVGKRHMWAIVEERRIEPFKSFEDIKKRVKLMPDPEKTIIKRILQELQGREKHYFFVDRRR